MTISKVLEMGLINDNTSVWIHNNELHVLIHGNWYQDNILEYQDREIGRFAWQDDNQFYIDLK